MKKIDIYSTFHGVIMFACLFIILISGACLIFVRSTSVILTFIFAIVVLLIDGWVVFK